MVRVLKKGKSKAKRVQKRLGPLLPILLTALLVGIVTWGLGYLYDLFWVAPAVEIRGLFSGDVLWTIAPQYVLFTTASVLGALAGTWYFAYRPNKEQVRERWDRVPTWIQATAIGLCFATLSVAGTLSLRAFWTISDLAVLSVFLVAWPLAAGTVILRKRCIDDDCPRKTSLRIGYLHAKGLETRMVAIIIGSLIGVVGGLAFWSLSVRYTDWDVTLLSVLVAAVLWMLVTVIAYNRYDGQTAAQTDLEIVEVNRPSTREMWELGIRNRSKETIDLSLAKVRDTEFDLYQFGVHTDLGPGETCTFNAPEHFRLEPNDDSWELPLGYTLKQGSETPAVLTRTGEMYALQREGLESGTPDEEPTTAGSSGATSPSGGGPRTEPAPQD